MSYHCPNFAIEKIEYQMKNVNHIVWADLIRVIAILMVICIHCSDPFNVSPEARLNPEYNLWGEYLWSFLASVRTVVCDADRNVIITGRTGNRTIL